VVDKREFRDELLFGDYLAGHPNGRRNVAVL
jgi:GrpB-like predicted nucleotidyltransferase (UPF0157 family)